MASGSIESTAVAELPAALNISVTSTSQIHAYRRGNVVQIVLIFNPTSNITANDVIGHITLPNNLIAGILACGSTNILNLARFYTTVTGDIVVENAVSANQWISITMMGLLSN